MILLTPNDQHQPSLLGIGALIKQTRTAQGLSIQQLAEATGASATTLSLIERGDNSAEFHSYAMVARHLNIDWALAGFMQTRGEAHTPGYYLTGATALALPGPDNQPPALWYTSALANPGSWRIAGRDLVSTTNLLGTSGLRDVTRQLEHYGVYLPRVWAANHERAIFDLPNTP